MRSSTASRSHIVREPGGDITLCGLKRRDWRSDDGTTMAWWVQTHVDGHDPEWCAACVDVYERHPRDSWPTPDLLPATLDALRATVDVHRGES